MKNGVGCVCALSMMPLSTEFTALYKRVTTNNTTWLKKKLSSLSSKTISKMLENKEHVQINTKKIVIFLEWEKNLDTLPKKIVEWLISTWKDT